MFLIGAYVFQLLVLSRRILYPIAMKGRYFFFLGKPIKTSVKDIILMVAEVDKNVQRQAGWPQYIKCSGEAGGGLSA